VDHPKAIGDRCTLAVMLALQARGLPFSIPFGENTRYDLIVDLGHELLRVQCKSGRLRLGAVRFKTASSYAHHPNPKTPKRDYLGEIDAFAVYCPETRGVYLVPIEQIALTWQGALRVDPPRNGQRRRIRFAADYEIAKVTLDASSAPAASAGAG
jgi:hypothetical protein